MGASYGGDAAVFLIGTLFELYVLVIMLRFLFQLVRADFYNDISQFVVKLSDPPLRALRRFVPGVAGMDVAPLVLMLGLKVIELWLIREMVGQPASPAGLAVLSAAELIELAINVFFFSILIQVILSWINPGAYNPVISILYSLNEPLLAPARRLIPPISGLDLSPIVVIVLLRLTSILVVRPIADMGHGLL